MSGPTHLLRMLHGPPYYGDAAPSPLLWVMVVAAACPSLRTAVAVAQRPIAGSMLWNRGKDG